MPEEELPNDAADDEEAEAPDRDFPISATARFSIGGKALVLDDFVDITTGDLANRPPVEPRPQPGPLPKAVVWNSRRPLE